MQTIDMQTAKTPAAKPAAKSATKPALAAAAAVVARFCAFALLLCAAAFAQAEPGDATAGAELYNQSCLTCHGPGGASQIAANPIIAGQHHDYLRRQLLYYRDNPKAAAAMAAMAKPLSDEDIDNISAYLAARPRPISGAADMELAKSGENLYRGGDNKREIPACAGCHIADGGGVPGSYPALSGQYEVYTAKALADYASGAREHAVMSGIAKQLTDDDIKKLAAYISGLAP